MSHKPTADRHTTVPQAEGLTGQGDRRVIADPDAGSAASGHRPALSASDPQVRWDAREIHEDGNAYLERVLIGGRERVDITVVDYDERWPQRFQEFAGQVCRALGATALVSRVVSLLAVR